MSIEQLEHQLVTDIEEVIRRHVLTKGIIREVKSGSSPSQVVIDIHTDGVETTPSLVINIRI